jgi:hypothetical protein
MADVDIDDLDGQLDSVEVNHQISPSADFPRKRKFSSGPLYQASTRVHEPGPHQLGAAIQRLILRNESRASRSPASPSRRRPAERFYVRKHRARLTDTRSE